MFPKQFLWQKSRHKACCSTCFFFFDLFEFSKFSAANGISNIFDKTKCIIVLNVILSPLFFSFTRKNINHQRFFCSLCVVFVVAATATAAAAAIVIDFVLLWIYYSNGFFFFWWRFSTTTFWHCSDFYGIYATSLAVCGFLMMFLTQI